jgi:hypothetical protein
MTNNIKITSFESWDGITTEWVEINRGNGEFTSMLKSTYDEMIANQPSLEV